MITCPVCCGMGVIMEEDDNGELYPDVCDYCDGLGELYEEDDDDSLFFMPGENYE